MGLARKFWSPQAVAKESDDRDTGHPVVDRGLWKAVTPKCLDYGASRIFVCLSHHHCGRICLGSLSGNIIQGTRKPICGMHGVFFTSPLEDLTVPLQPVVPMILFAASAPTVLGIYRFVAIRSTDFERHDTHSTYAYSLAIKRFILSTIVSYFGITLSAFIYMPFGQEVLGSLHLQLFAFDVMGMTSPLAGEEDGLVWEHDLFKASTKLNGTRLQTQMFAFLVTAQLANAFQELGMPYVIRWLQSRISPPTKVKRPGDRSGTPDEKLLDRIKEEVSTRLDYDVFDDYCEMVTQFGYVAIWSSIWPLAPGEYLLQFWLSVG